MTDAADFPRATIAIFLSGKPKHWWVAVAYWAIRVYQKVLKQYKRDTDAIHAVIKVGGVGEDDWLSTEAPRTVIRHLYGHGARISFYQYRYIDQATGTGWDAFNQAVMRLNGTDYDFGQLIQIILDYFKWTGLNTDLSDNDKVCSVSVAFVLRALTKADNLPQALTEPVEDTAPAAFGNSPNFELIEEWP